MAILWAVLLGTGAIVCWLLNLFGLPGNWLVVIAAAAYAWLLPAGQRVSMSWQSVAALVTLALIGEVIEFASGAAATRKAGGSRRAAVLALLGAMLGGIAGAVVGLPVPIVGPIVAAILFASVGALGGAVLGEIWLGRSIEQSWQVGKSAFWGRLFGTLGKILVGSIMVVVVLASLMLA